MYNFRPPPARKPVRMQSLADGIVKRQLIPTVRGNEHLFPAKSIDMILSLLEKGLIEDISVIDWLTLIDEKNTWDKDKDDETVAYSCALIYQTALKDNSILQLLLTRAATSLDDPKNHVFPNSLFQHLDQLDGFLSGYWKVMYRVVSAAWDGEFKEIAEAAAENWLLTQELFNELNLPTCTSLKDKTDEHIPAVLAECKPDNLVGWLSKLTSMTEVYMEFVVIQGLLRNRGVSILSKQPMLLKWLHERCGPTAETGYWSRLESEERRILSNLMGLANYGQIEKLSALLRTPAIFAELNLQEWDERHIRGRSNFWHNYSGRMLSVRILVPESTMQVLKRHESEFSLDLDRIDLLLPSQLPPDDQETEVIVMEFEKLLIIDALRGGHNVIRVYQHTYHLQEKFLKGRFSYKDVLATPMHSYFDHVSHWQGAAESWLRKTLKIKPNDDTRHFFGLSKEKGKYDPVLGLPLPTGDQSQKRAADLEKWARQIEFEEQRYRRSS